MLRYPSRRVQAGKSRAFPAKAYADAMMQPLLRALHPAMPGCTTYGGSQVENAALCHTHLHALRRMNARRQRNKQSNMNTHDTRPQGRRDNQRGGRRRYNDRNDRNRGPRENRTPQAPKKLTFWQKIVAFFTGGAKKKTAPAQRTARPPYEGKTERRAPRPEAVEVSSPKLYVGNLSYETAESDLFDLFKGVGEVQSAEIVTNKATYKSKGFGFVTMLTVDEAKRAVATLHDKPFMGRSLVVSGSKSESTRD